MSLCDRDYSRSKLLQEVAFVKKFITPLLTDSIVTLTTAARILLPIAGVKYVHTRNEIRGNGRLPSCQTICHSLEKQMIVRHVTECKYDNKHDTGTLPAKRCRCTTACVSPTVTANSINLPNLESGNAYNKMEVVNIMLKVPECNHSCCYSRSDSEASTEIQYSMLQNFYLLCAGKPCKGSNNKEKAEFTAKNKIPKKGMLREALVGTRNKILIAFECRLLKNSI